MAASNVFDSNMRQVQSGSESFHSLKHLGELLAMTVVQMNV